MEGNNGERHSGEDPKEEPQHPKRRGEASHRPPGNGSPDAAKEPASQPDFFGRLAERALGTDQGVHPVLPSRFGAPSPGPGPFWRQALEEAGEGSGGEGPGGE